MELNIHNLIDDAKCFEAVRNLRWPDKVNAHIVNQIILLNVVKIMHRSTGNVMNARLCGKRFDDLTSTMFAGHH